MKRNLKQLLNYLEMPYPKPKETRRYVKDLMKELRSDLIQNTHGLSKENKAFVKGFQFALRDILGDSSEQNKAVSTILPQNVETKEKERKS
jgi:hypothetical protein